MLAVATSACSGPNGVTLGDDWKGSQEFVLARDGGQLTVVGIDPVARRAEPLTVVPGQADDDDTLAPQIVRPVDGGWLIAVPRKGSEPDRTYRLDAPDRAVARQSAVLEQSHGLVPTAHYLAGVPALPDTGEGCSVLVQSPGTLALIRTVRVPGAISQAAGGPGKDVLCATGDADGSGGATRVLTVDLAAGRVTREVAAPHGFEAQTLACDNGTPVLGGPAGASVGSTAKGAVTLVRRDGMLMVTVGGGRVDRLAVRGGVLAAAVNVGNHEVLATVDAASGRVLGRVTLSGLTDASAVLHTRQGWLVVSPADGAALVSNGSPRATRIALPGRYLAS